MATQSDSAELLVAGAYYGGWKRLSVSRSIEQIAGALQEHLEPLGVGVVIKARHMCMESRGICQQGHHTITSALHGLLRDDPDARAEFLRLAM